MFSCLIAQSAIKQDFRLRDAWNKQVIKLFCERARLTRVMTYCIVVL